MHNIQTAVSPHPLKTRQCLYELHGYTVHQ